MTPPRNYAIDTLRTVAGLLIVLLHVCASYVNYARSNEDLGAYFQIANVVDSFCRIGVPLFVLISGRFLLGRQETCTYFYKKRTARLLIPLIFWSLAYSTVLLLTRYIRDGSWDMKDLLNGFVLGQPFYHLWYLYMLVGLYAVTPALNSIVSTLSRRNLLILSAVLIGVGMINNMYDFYYVNENFFLIWFINYLGYYLLGYALKDTRKIAGGLLIGIYIISASTIAALSAFTAAQYGSFYFYTYQSPFVIIGSIAVYKLFCQLSVKENFLSRISKYVFGIYLTHAGILYVITYTKIGFIPNAFVGIPLIFIGVTAVSLAAAWAIGKTKYFRNII